MIRVGFTLIGGQHWTGGRNYLLNLLRAVSLYESSRITPVVFVGSDVPEVELTQLRDLQAVQVVVSEVWNADHNLVRLVNGLMLGRDGAIFRQLREHSVDVFFESARYVGWRPGVAAIAWVPDLQHRVMPHFFTRSQWLRREIGIRAQVRAKRVIMLSSACARRDFERFYPAAIGRTRVVRFSVSAVTTMGPDAARKVADSYGLPRKYFFVPNHFWRHKNHGLVLDALIALKKRQRDVTVVATGEAHDPRAPDHFGVLMQKVRQEDIGALFRHLGVVPYEHLGALLRASVALVNPSHFEGWSTTVEEARALGVPAILSDLPVHHEQMGDQAAYFDPLDPESLARILESFASGERCRGETDAKAIAENASARHREFAAVFANLCEEAKAGNSPLA